VSTNQHQRDVFRWQLFSAKIIFTIVILQVVASIYSLPCSSIMASNSVRAKRQ
jgi:hypothetical protein